MATKQETVKIVLATGYLGAGKTALPNHTLTNDRDMNRKAIEADLDACLVR